MAFQNSSPARSCIVALCGGRHSRLRALHVVRESRGYELVDREITGYEPFEVVHRRSLQRDTQQLGFVASGMFSRFQV